MRELGRFAVATTLALLFVTIAPAAEPQPSSAVPLRVLRIGGPLALPEVRAHIEFGVGIGFNALWVPAVEAGQWDKRSPRLRESFLELARWCESREVRLLVALHPVHGADETFRFADARAEKRLRRFLKRLAGEAGVREFVLAFDEAPLKLTDLEDALQYGPSSAPAHLDLAARLAAGLGEGERLWLLPAVASDRGLDDPELPYAAALREKLAGLDPRVGLVWHGPERVSPIVSAGDLAATSERSGGRPLLLLDLYPAGQAPGAVRLSLVLGPLRHRAAQIRREAAGYVATPMGQLGASRLALLTTADFLSHPAAYDPEASWRAALERLAGEDPEALEALRTQAVEWGGWVGERNYHTALTDNPRSASLAVRDPAMFALWGWTRRRYPERMQALEGLADPLFRADLLEVMARRLAIARALPTVRELRARLSVGRTDTAALVRQLENERRAVAGQPVVRLALDRFLLAAGVAEILEAEPADEPSAPTHADQLPGSR